MFGWKRFRLNELGEMPEYIVQMYVDAFMEEIAHRIACYFDYDIDELNAPQLSLLLGLLAQLDGRDGFTLERACREAFARVVMEHGGPDEFDLDHGLFWCAWQFLPIDQ
jgi:hypothetical protein